MFSRNLQNVTDPSDWRQSKVPGLSQLDSLQRCFICKEYLKAPVMTGCNHTFCSQCIRQYLLAHNCCPLCHTEQYESNLKRNILLDEIVTCFSGLRPKLMDHLREEKDPEVIEISSSPEPRAKETPGKVTPPVTSSEETPPAKRCRTSSPDVGVCPICSREMSLEVLQTTHIDECLNGKSPQTQSPPAKPTYQSQKKRPKSSISSFFQSTRKEQNHDKFYFEEAASHQHEEKRLPKLDFSSLTTPRLKEKLAALKLPVQGTRHQLELRYNHFYILFNSNLDSNHPVADKILKQRLSQWEMSHSAFNTSSSSLFSQGGLSHKSITDKDFSVKMWMDAYSGEFKDLVKQAKALARRERQARAAEVAEPQAGPLGTPGPSSELPFDLKDSPLFNPR